jgi:predicted RNA binding protein YcfA (HicA-like mRNA interferase family)
MLIKPLYLIGFQLSKLRGSHVVRHPFLYETPFHQQRRKL